MAGSGQGIRVAPSRTFAWSGYLTIPRTDEEPFGWKSSVCKILNILFENTVRCYLTSLETPAQPLSVHIYAKQNANEPIEPFVCLLPSWEPGSLDKLLLPAFVSSRKAFLIRTSSF